MTGKSGGDYRRGWEGVKTRVQSVECAHADRRSEREWHTAQICQSYTLDRDRILKCSPHIRLLSLLKKASRTVV